MGLLNKDICLKCSERIKKNSFSEEDWKRGFVRCWMDNDGSMFFYCLKNIHEPPKSDCKFYLEQLVSFGNE